LSNEAKVGSLVLITLFVLSGTFLYIANVQVGKKRVNYQTYFKNASGLEEGTIVRYGGMRAGVVTGVHPSAKDPTRIEVAIQVNADAPVNADSIAMVSAISPVGNKHLEITVGNNSARRLKPGETIPSQEEVSLNEVMNKISSLADNAAATIGDVRKAVNSVTNDANDVLANLKTLTGPENQKNVAQIINGANDLLAKEAPKIDRIVENVDRLTANADKLVSDFRVVADNANQTVAGANRLVDETREPLKRDLEELEKTIVEARKTLEEVRGIVGVNREKVNEMVENLDSASRNLDEFTNQIKRQPWSLIRIKPEPDRKVPVPGGK
jgi:phospholipid/cholesterol/gamma-HCH transport system substrate-binding protein